MSDSTPLKVKLSKRTIDAIEPPAEGFIRVWDTETKGFHLRVRANGRKTFELKYRVGERQATMTIGDFGTFTAETAREAANEAKRIVRLGGDPLATRGEARKAITVRELIGRYLKEGPIDKPNKRVSSWETDRINLLRHVEPLLGARPVRDLNPGDLARWQRAVAMGKTAAKVKRAPRPSAAMKAEGLLAPQDATRIVGLSASTLETLRSRGNSAPFVRQNGRVLYPAAELREWAETRRARNDGVARGGRGCAARAMCSLSAMLSWAARHQIIEANPARHVEKLPTGKRERFLSEKEAKSLWNTVADLEARKKLRADVADLFRLLALTGARRGEILGLRWSEVDFERGLIVLPPDRHKSGATGKGRVIHIDAAAVTILRARQHNVVSNNSRLKRIVPWVFPKEDGKGPIEPPKRAWIAVRSAAGLDDLRLHDLRHTYASLLLAEGTPLALVGKALGHTKAATTERYAHLRDDATQRGAAHVASVYSSATARNAPQKP